MDHVLYFMIRLLVFLSRFSKRLAGLGIGSYEEHRPGDKLRILLAGYNGARNTGSDVRVVAIARQLKELFGADRIRITVMTLDPATMEGYFDEDVTLLPFSSFYPLHLYRACCTHHAAILCEGSTLKSTFANALTLFMCEAAGIMGAQKKPCIAYGSEVGAMEPFLEKAARRLCRDTYFITRTEESLAALRKLGLEGHAGTDTAWLYDGAISGSEADRLLMAQGWDGKKPLLGVAVIDPFCWPVRASLWKWLKGRLSGNLSGQYDKWYFFSDSPTRRANQERYLAQMAAGVKGFLEKHAYFPVLIGMERLDEKPCRDLREKLGVPCAMFLSGDREAAVMTGVLRRLSALVTSRYHAAVLSMEAACPVVAVSMDERLDNIMQELSFDRTELLHVWDEDLGARLTRALEDACAHADEIHRHIRHQTEIYREKLDRMGVYLKGFLTDAL